MEKISAVALASIALSFSFASHTAASAKIAPAAAGGTNARASVEGCMNTWLFDGIWRIRVTNVSASGSEVRLEVRNGSHDSLTTADSGFAAINGQGIDLALSDGSIRNLNISTTNFREELSTLKLPPGGKATTTLRFDPPADANVKPVKLLIAVDPKYNSYVHYTVKDPSFRVHLDCSK
ncbi:MAG: DUF4352 domain-containing protein [Candidatus Eremiobacteraeota bacterium]|nr:DUF4352 domain-containing protein [Candidatus Eremiobacteraeota bacterium]